MTNKECCTIDAVVTVDLIDITDSVVSIRVSAVKP
jgi:hypothetical protein